MIHETEENGRVFGQVLCGNPACQRVLRTYEGEGNSPGPMEYGYRLLKAEKRVLFTDRHGRPLRAMPPGNPCQFLGVNVVVSLDDRIVGYECVPGSGVFVEDFCSDRCASAFLKSNKQWNLCFRQQSDGGLLFVAQAAERLFEGQVQVDWPPIAFSRFRR